MKKNNMNRLILFLLCTIGMARPRPPASGYCLRHFPLLTLDSSPSPLLGECVFLVNVPRSGSTWFLSILFDAFGTDSKRVRATHYPFFNYSRPVLEYEWEGHHCTTVLLVRDPHDAYPSFLNIFGQRAQKELSWAYFSQQYEYHNEFWRNHSSSVIEIQYEQFSKNPPFYAQLESSYLMNAHRDWV